MSRRTKSKNRATGRQTTSFGTSPHSRRLHFEALESRRLLATFPVTNLLDGVVTASGDLPGSLRQAVFDSNASVGTDTILFDAGLSGVILLTSGEFPLGEFSLTEAITITGPGASQLTIDAQGNSRIFNFTATVGDFTIEGLTLANGRTTADNGLFDSSQSGGAIRSLSAGLLTLNSSTVSGSRTEGNFADGGGIYAKGDVLLDGASLAGNRTEKLVARGGGLFTKGSLTVINDSFITGNTTGKLVVSTVFGDGAIGGGAAALGDILVTNSTVSNNGTLADDSSGGGLFATGSITIIDSEVQNNSTQGSRAAGGGVFALGDVSVTRSILSGNRTEAEIVDVLNDLVNDSIPYDNVGGGIRSGGDVVVDSSSISGNFTQGQAASGGGIFALGNVELRNSTLSGNRVVSPGEVVLYFGQGENHGRYVDSSANGGGVFAYGSLTATNSTIYGNSVNNFAGRGGGLAAYGAVTLANTIVSGNSDLIFDPLAGVDGFRYIGNFGSSHPDIWAASGSLTATYSLVGDVRGTTLSTSSPGTNVLNKNARLLPLANNDDEPTQTHVLRFDSPAIDRGDPNFAGPPNVDQRGANRVLGGRIDIGAYERDLFDPVVKVVDILDDELDSNVLPGDLSLREALSFSPVGPEPLFVMFAPSLAGGTISLTLGELVVASPTVIIGFPDNRVIVDAQNNTSVIRIDASAGQVELRGMKLTNGRANLQGGGIYSLLTGSLTVEDSEISNSYAETIGGGIYAVGDLTLVNSTITGNDSNKGGGIYSRGDVALTKSSMVQYNHTSGFSAHGGGIYALGDVTLVDSMVENNETYGSNSDGGGISSAGDVTLINSDVDFNRSNGNGGGISAENILAINTSIEDNYADADGGGINAANDVVLTSSSVNFNEADDDGGGVHAGASVSINNSDIDSNEANDRGGGVRAGTVFVRDSDFDDNRVSNSSSSDNNVGNGGAISGITVSVTNSRFEFNEALASSFNDLGGFGGAIDAGTATVVDSTFFENEARRSGGAIRASTLTLTNSSVSFNYADGGGGLFASNVTLTGSTVSDNRSQFRGGGILAEGAVTIQSSTISGNTLDGNGAGAGIYATSYGDINIEFSTIVNNYGVSGTDGAGLYMRRRPSINIQHSIVSGNTSGIAPSDIYRRYSFGTTQLESYHSLLGEVDNITVNGPAIFSNDPQLESLAFNGGPTRTHAPQTGSPIVDTGAPFFFADLDFDQRGAPFDRVVGGRIDIGAFETQGPVPDLFLVNTVSDSAGDGYFNVTLREAIGFANATSGHQTITFDPLVFGTPGTILLSKTFFQEGELLITDDVTIVGPGQDLLTIDAQNGNNGIFGDGDGWRIFNIDDSDNGNLISVTLNGLTLTGGDTLDAVGGAILSRENLTIIDSEIIDNANSGGAGYAGAIHSSVGDLTIIGSTISGNATDGGVARGGGIFVINGDLELTDSTISGNTTVGVGADGGGIYQFNGNLTVTDSTISGNQSGGYGGGIYILVGDLTVTNSTISGNSTATGSGGGIGNRLGVTRIQSSTITGNSAPVGKGSGIASSGSDGNGTLTQISNSIVAGNVNEDLAIKYGTFNAFQSNGYNLIGSGADFDSGNQNALDPFTTDVTNRLGVSPTLASLADNGGPTLTHSPMPGSLAINAGDPSILFSPTDFDQRGDPFARVSGGQIDIGAVEVPGGNNNTGVEILVVDLITDQRYVYSGDEVLVDTSNLASGNNGPRGIAASPDGSILWVVDTDSNVYYYDGDGNSQGQWSFTGFSGAQGIATDGTDIWIVSNGSDDVHRFVGGVNFTGGTHAPDFSFNLAGDNVDPFGITTDGNKLWVVNDRTDLWKTFIYNTSGVLQGSWDLDPGNKNARGITLDPADPTNILVVNAGNPKQIYRYNNSINVISGSLTASGTFLLDAANASPHGLGGRVIGTSSQTIGDADFDADGDVDGNDFLIWQRGVGTPVPDGTQSLGDADGDTDVDGADRLVWQEQYGTGAFSALTQQAAPYEVIIETNESTAAPAGANLVDAALAFDLFYSHRELPAKEREVLTSESTQREIVAEPTQWSLLKIIDRIYQEFGDSELIRDLAGDERFEEATIDPRLADTVVRSSL